MRLIDADELIKNIDYSLDLGGPMGKVVTCVKEYAKYMIASAPTKEPERKKGKWRITNITCDVTEKWYVCSECGAAREQTTFLEYFCPCCGTDMRDFVLKIQQGEEVEENDA